MRLRSPALAAVVLGAAVCAWTGPATAAPRSRDTCIECHSMLEPRLSAPTRAFTEDIHYERGLGCAGCHGGNPDDPDVTAMDPDLGFRGTPTRAQIAELCASCHAKADYMKHFDPQPYIFSMDEFRTSVHCKKISEGDLKVATCTNCHGVHGIKPHTDPTSRVYPTNVPTTCSGCHNAEYMKGRKVRTDQHALYQTSVHGVALLEKGDLSAPACNDCHGNHGAVPPQTRDISLVCGNCHRREGDLFAQSKVGQVLEVEGKRACVACHGNHAVQRPTDAMLSTGPEGVCGQCHEPGSPGEQAVATLLPRFHALKARIDAADSLLTRADRLGMETEIGRERLRQAADQLVSFRAVLHSFDTDQISKVLDEGSESANGAHEQGERVLRDWRSRRIGMGLSLIVILATIGLLIFKIRAIESRPADSVV
jgi:hypothetical protein